ncbi:MAG: hypothetical protein NZ551_06600 [Microscillaceae bacterium]|nr:hypothetical protein [Microscillaceae bacterium]MDW8460863.1 hypothetical protein [Cytophagales bacterium]
MLFFLLVAISLAVSQYFLNDWWLAMAVPAVWALLLSSNGWRAFFGGFFAVALVWLAYAFLLNLQNEGLLAGKMAKLFSLPNSEYMLLVTSILGGLVGAFGALFGFSIRSLWLKKKQKPEPTQMQ